MELTTVRNASVRVDNPVVARMLTMFPCAVFGGYTRRLFAGIEERKDSDFDFMTTANGLTQMVNCGFAIENKIHSFQPRIPRGFQGYTIRPDRGGYRRSMLRIGDAKRIEFVVPVFGDIRCIGYLWILGWCGGRKG